MTTKEVLHRLIEELPEEGLPAVERLLAGVRDRSVDLMRLSLLTAPIDDEPTTPEEDEGAAEAWEEYRRGEYVTNDELRREIGW